MTLDWLLTLTPILTILVLMLGFRWKSVRAGPVGWLVAVLVAALRFGAGWDVLFWAQVKALFLALWVLYVVWTALLFYRVTDEAGAIATIGAALTRLTTDRALQALLVGWVFAAFLQGVSGFGVPVAVVGPLLVGLGFPTVTAVVIASVGHSWAVTFGSLSSSFYALMATTGRPGEELAAPSAALLGLACFLCGAGTLWAAGGWQTVRREWAPLLMLGTVMGGTQYLVVTHGLWPIGATTGGLAGLGAGVLWARWRARGTISPRPESTLPLDLRWAVVPYGLLVLIIILGRLVTPVETFLDRVVIQVEVPELTTARGWVTPASTTRPIALFGHAGALLAYASLLTYGLFRWKGAYRPGVTRRIVHAVVRRGVLSGIAIVAMVGIAVTMDHAGMVHLLAEGFARAVGPAFPLVSPFIGALGAFMTGSNTNSNVVFGALQERVAMLVGMNPVLALAAQTAGAAIGGMFAPAKIIVGCAPVEADEGTTMRKTMTYGLVILGMLGGVVALADWLRLL